MNIKYGMEYLFTDKLGEKAVIMKIEPKILDNPPFQEAQNYILEDDDSDVWGEISIKDFNKMNLVLIDEYDPNGLQDIEESEEKLAKFAGESLRIDVSGCYNWEDTLGQIRNHFEKLEDADPDLNY